MDGEMLYDPITGENVTSASLPTIFYKGKGAQSGEYGYYTHGRGYKYKKNSYKVVQVVRRNKFPWQLSDADLGKFFKLGMAICPANGMIAVCKRRTWIPADTKEVAKVLDISESRVRSLFSKLKQLSIIKRAAGGIYYVNPLYIAPKYISPEMFLVWRDILENEIPQQYQEKLLADASGIGLMTTSDGRRVNEDGEIIEEETDADGD